jgi:hypothetical protein
MLGTSSLIRSTISLLDRHSNSVTYSNDDLSRPPVDNYCHLQCWQSQLIELVQQKVTPAEPAQVPCKTEKRGK